MSRWRVWSLVVWGLVGVFGCSFQAERNLTAPAHKPVPQVAPPLAPPTASMKPPTDMRTVRGRVLGPDGPVAGAAVMTTVAQVLAPVDLERCPSEVDGLVELDLLSPRCRVRLPTLESWVTEHRAEAPVLARTTTDREGFFELAEPEAAKFVLWVESPVGAGALEDMTPGMGEVEVRLDAARLLMGRVRDDEGHPAEGVAVSAIHATQRHYFEARTDGQGWFQFPPLPSGGYSVVFTGAGLLSHEEFLYDANARLSVKMARSRRLSGQVLRGGTPVVGARVSLHGGAPSVETVADDAGRFFFDGARPGLQVLAARYEGLVALEEVMVREGGPTPDATLLLGTAVWMRGTVRDSRGRAIANASVSARAPREDLGSLWPDSQNARSAADGSYVLGPLLPKRYEVRVGARRFLEPPERWVQVDGAKPVDFVLRPSVVVEGRVVDTNGEPVSRADVIAWFPVEDSDSIDVQRVDAARSGDVGLRIGALTQSGADGSFVLDTEKKGRWLLSVQHESYPTVLLPVASPNRGLQVALDAAAQAEGGAMAARREQFQRALRDPRDDLRGEERGSDVEEGARPLTRTVTGRVTNAVTGAAVVGALVMASEDAPEDAGAWCQWEQVSLRDGVVKTGVDGTFTLPEVGPLAVTLVVAHPFHVQQRVRLPAPGAPMTVALAPGATVQGTLRGVSPRFLQVTLSQGEDDCYPNGIPAWGGLFSRTDVPAGTYVATVTATSDRAALFDMAPQSITVPAGGKVTLEFVNRERSTLLLRAPLSLDDFDVALVPDKVSAPVDASALPDILGRSLECEDDDGRTRVFKSLSGGRYTVFVFDQRGDPVRMSRQEVTVPERSKVTRELKLNWVALPAPAPK